MKNKKGISLIVLVITIIVMVILAGAIILTLNNSGIINKASDAVEKTNEATIKELAQLAWAEAYTEYGANQEKLEEGVNTALTKNNINTEAYNIIVTTSGVEIFKGWLQEGLTVVKGSQKLQVGDTINYDETKGGTVTVEKDVTWKVLGAENGELLIMSADSVVTTAYGLGDYNGNGDIDLAQDGFLNGPSKLNTICEAYGKGTGAVSSRSIKIEDINRVTGYNPVTAAYGKGQLEEYGNEVVYTWNGEDGPSYRGTNGKEGTTLNHGGEFTYFDGEKLVTSINTGATKESPKEIVTLKNDYYIYYGTTLTSNSSDEKKGLGVDTKAYKMLFRDSGNTKNDNYWFASSFKFAAYDYEVFGLRYVMNGAIDGLSFFSSRGSNLSGASCGVRAVISLGANINLTGSSETGWGF